VVKTVPIAPDIDAVKAYLGESAAFEDDQITAALDAETVAQVKVCRLPDDADPDEPEPYPADLAEALCRRVAHNLALRNLPLGIQANIADGAVSTNRVGGIDAEVARLERPYRKLVVR
jgi:hypothetical protein